MMMVKSMKKPILCAKYCSSEFLSAGLTRHVQAVNDIDDDDDDGFNDDHADDHDDSDDFILPHSSVHVFIQCIRDSDGPV